MTQPNGGLVERVWYGDDSLGTLGRALLWPGSLVYRAVVGARNAAFELGALGSTALAIPVVSVGNLTVGGTGKTPFAAWLAGRLASGGARPGVLLRGYGEDELLVHRRLNPSIDVYVGADRVESGHRAHRAGCDVVVLDDAFQHRRIRRVADVVLVSADDWSARRAVLPRGPWREPLTAIRRATHVVITRKAAGLDAVHAITNALGHIGVGVSARTTFALDRLNALGGDETMPLGSLAGRRVLAIAAIGNPSAFADQLRAVGARITLVTFRDHHRFTVTDVARVAARAEQHDVAVCTLKDAVKLASVWPRGAAPPWYVSQRVELEEGAGAMDALVQSLLAARASSRP